MKLTAEQILMEHLYNKDDEDKRGLDGYANGWMATRSNKKTPRESYGGWLGGLSATKAKVSS